MTRWTDRSLGHYRVGRLIGAGGMGEVYEAEDERLGRRIALKVLPAAVARDPERLSRFTREARSLAALNHPGIVTIHSVEESDGEHFITMELLEGRTLSESIASGGLASDKVLDVAIPLADALASAHERGIVHRDLKPGNVMLTGDGRVKVLDFGLAKALGPSGGGSEAPTLERTGDGSLVGTLPYLSPEQVAGRPADFRSDIFSFGVLLYEMTAGRRPFDGESAAAVLVAVMNASPPRLSSLSPGVLPALEALIDRCLEKDPSRRPASAAEIRAALEALRRGRPLSLSPESAAETHRCPSVAVLPFADMSPGHDQEYFCDGIAEEIINALTQLEGLQVAARTSSFAFKGKLEDVREIGRRLGVGAVLEGSVRKAGERLRITVQLIKVADGYQVWSERFDRAADDVFAIQDEISVGVVERLKVRLIAGEEKAFARRHVPGREAHDLYLKGRYFLNRRRPGDLQRAVANFEQAVVLDSQYAEPHVGIAETFLVLGLWGFLPPREALGRCKAELLRALELDESLPDAQCLLGSVLVLFEWDWDGAEPLFRRVQGIRGPRPLFFGLTLYHLAHGRTREGLEEAQRGAELEPLSAIAQTQAGACHIAVADVEGAARLLERAVELDGAMPMALFWLGFCRGVQGRFQEAEKLLCASADAGLLAALMYLPEVLMRAGKADEARAVVDALEKTASERYVSPLVRAAAHASIGDKEICESLLEEAATEPAPFFTLGIVGPGYSALLPPWVSEWLAARRVRILQSGARSGRAQ